jgi:hypothetical protein
LVGSSGVRTSLTFAATRDFVVAILQIGTATRTLSNRYLAVAAS